MVAGRTELAIDTASKLGRVLGLSSREVEYFKTLIHFERCRSIAEKNDFFEKLLEYRRQTVRHLENESLSLFAKWYYVPVRELLVLKMFAGDFAALGQLLVPPIGEVEAREAVGALESGGFVRQAEDGQWAACEAAVTTGDDIRSFMVVRFQKDMLDLAERSLSKVALEERDISGVTLSLSSDKIVLVKEEIRKFRQKIMQIAVDDADADRIWRCSVQLFPLSSRLEK